MSLRNERILRRLKSGPATCRELADACDAETAQLGPYLAQLQKGGLVRRVDGGERKAIYALAPGDDPSMIPGGPEPACEAAALAEEDDLGFEPDGELPTAGAIAVAICAAAGSLGEDPLLISEPGVWLRARFPAVKALAVFYPDCTWAQLGRFVGFTKLTQRAVENAANMPWWPDAGDPAFEAAVAALEAL